MHWPLDPGPFGHGRIFPLHVEPGVSRLNQGATVASLDQVPAGTGTIGISTLPLGFGFGPRAARNPSNPTAPGGFPTAGQFRAGQTFATTYAVAVEYL